MGRCQLDREALYPDGHALAAMTDLVRAYTFPERFAVELPIDRIVCDGKVDEGHVERIMGGADGPRAMKPIVVIKHPRQDVYAVLDGHHRFSAARRRGAQTIRAAVVDDYVGLGFELTKRGAFQPSSLFTKHVRVPAKRLASYMERFQRAPREMLREELKARRAELASLREGLIKIKRRR